MDYCVMLNRSQVALFYWPSSVSLGKQEAGQSESKAG